MSTQQWLLAFHVTGAFLLLGGAVAAAIFSVLAQRSTRPSEVALFLGLARFAVIPIMLGSVLALVFGLWLVHCLRLSYGSDWIVGAIVLLVLSSIAGRKGGERDAATRELALKLAAQGETEGAKLDPELRARLRDPRTLALSWGAGLGMVAILALMIWKPGA